MLILLNLQHYLVLCTSLGTVLESLQHPNSDLGKPNVVKQIHFLRLSLQTKGSVSQESLGRISGNSLAIFRRHYSLAPSKKVRSFCMTKIFHYWILSQEHKDIHSKDRCMTIFIEMLQQPEYGNNFRSPQPLGYCFIMVLMTGSMSSFQEHQR